MKKKIVLLAIVGVLVLSSVTWADNAPVATTPVDGGPTLISFKVWVLPHTENGVQKSGYYETFDLLVDLSDGFEALDTPPAQPVIAPIPASPSAGK